MSKSVITHLLGPKLPTSKPRKWTKEDKEKVVNYYATMKLQELRVRQDLARRQIGWAVDQDNADACTDLQVIERLLTQAVMKREFPQDLIGYS